MPQSGYQANFTSVGLTVAGFDINQSSYQESNQANATVRAIPWANPPNASLYAVVVQVGGLQPRTRTYKATVYSELDYGALRALVGQFGLVTTPREPAQTCMLNAVKRGDRQDVTSPTGPQTLDLEFVMTQ